MVKILDPYSLVKTLDNVNERLLYNEPITREEGQEVSHWIISLQGERGSYRGLFAPTPSDFKQGMHTFTGERLVSASARHIIGQEAARAVWLLGSTDPQAREAYHSATGWMREDPDIKDKGTYCCGRCTLAFWRHFWVGDFKNKEAYLESGLKSMRANRLDDGKWRAFPFFYAIYTLVDLELEAAEAELKYARPVMEKYVENFREGAFSHRRVAILEKALNRIG